MLVLISAFASSALLVGGEWAGWCCNYASSGKLKPVPDQLLSDTALEWGQVPNGFEELTSEWLSHEGTVARRTVRILPEDGCNVENVGAQISRMSLPLGASTDPPAVAIDTQSENELWRIETIFDGLGTSYPSEKKGALRASALRTRIVFDFDPVSGRMAPGGLSAWQERRWDSTAGALSLQEGGGRTGLDASWVSTAVGVDCYADGDTGGRMVGSTLYLPSVGVSVLLEEEALAVALERVDGEVVTVQRIFDRGECSSRLIGAPPASPDAIPKLQVY